MTTHSDYEYSRDECEDILSVIFDHRFDGNADRTLLAILLPSSKQLHIFAVTHQADKSFKVVPRSVIPAISAVSLRATREEIADLLYVTPDGQLKLCAYGLQTCNIHLRREDDTIAGTIDVSMGDANGDRSMRSFTEPKIVKIEDPVNSSVKIAYGDGKSVRLSTYLIPNYHLVQKILERLSVVLNETEFMAIAAAFLSSWTKAGRSAVSATQYECLENAILQCLGLNEEGSSMNVAATNWQKLSSSTSQFRLHDDTALLKLDIPTHVLRHRIIQPMVQYNSRLARLLLYVLQNVAGEMRVLVYERQDLFRLAPLLCRIAQTLRPELVDYWKRLFPTCADSWLSLGM